MVIGGGCDGRPICSAAKRASDTGISEAPPAFLVGNAAPRSLQIVGSVVLPRHAWGRSRRHQATSSGTWPGSLATRLSHAPTAG
jgi:hypothetical protein